MKLNQTLTDFLAPNKKDITRILNAIKRYDRIAIFRHEKPDFDALGSQMGLATWIKDNFPDKEVHVLGDNHVVFTGVCYCDFFNMRSETAAAAFFMSRILYQDDIINCLGNS